MKGKIVLLACLAAATPGVQDPPERAGAGSPAKEALPQPPAGAPALPPVRDLPRTAVERRDLLQRFAPESPLEGFYRLVSFGVADSAPVGSAGYLAIGRAHLSVHLLAPSSDGPPVMQSAFRSYRVSEGRLFMTTLLGVRSDEDGELVVDPLGAVRVVPYTLLGTLLRLDLGANRVLEFQRIE
jgi:hypothetical protein